MSRYDLPLRIRLSPKASANRINGVLDTPDGTALKIMVTAPPDKGKANAALIKLLAKKFGVARRQISLIFGPTSRNKVLEIKGDGPALRQQLERLLQEFDGATKS